MGGRQRGGGSNMHRFSYHFSELEAYVQQGGQEDAIVAPLTA